MLRNCVHSGRVRNQSLIRHTAWWRHMRHHCLIRPNRPRARNLGRNRFAKPNRNRFQIFGFHAIDLSNLKPVSRNRRNLLGRWFRLRNRQVTVLLLCFVWFIATALTASFVCGNANFCSSFTVNMRVIQSKSLLLWQRKQFSEVTHQTLPKSTLQKYFIATALTASTA